MSKATTIAGRCFHETFSWRAPRHTLPDVLRRFGESTTPPAMGAVVCPLKRSKVRIWDLSTPLPECALRAGKGVQGPSGCY